MGPEGRRGDQLDGWNQGEVFEPGIYSCLCCETVLFDASEKFESGTDGCFGFGRRAGAQSLNRQAIAQRAAIRAIVTWPRRTMPSAGDSAAIPDAGTIRPPITLLLKSLTIDSCRVFNDFGGSSKVS
jgi:hypothetical protein